MAANPSWIADSSRRDASIVDSYGCMCYGWGPLRTSALGANVASRGYRRDTSVVLRGIDSGARHFACHSRLDFSSPKLGNLWLRGRVSVLRVSSLMVGGIDAFSGHATSGFAYVLNGIVIEVMLRQSLHSMPWQEVGSRDAWLLDRSSGTSVAEKSSQ